MVAKIVALVVPLGLDTFAISAALGTVGLDRHQRTRVSALMVGFEAGMPLIGLALGAPIGHAIGTTADYLAIGVLLAFGLFTLFGGDAGDEEQRAAGLANLHGFSAVVLGISISLDELAVGFTFGLLRLPVVPVIILIAAQTLVVSQAGMRLGQSLSQHIREGAEQLAGVALIALAAVLLVERLTS